MSPIEILVGPRNCGKSSEAKRMAKDLFEKENIVILDGKELNLDNPFVWGACTHHTKMIIVDGCPENFNYSYFIPRIVLSKNNEYSISLFCHRIGENPIIVHVDHIIFVTEFKPEISSDLIGITLFSKPPKIDKIHLIHLLDPIRGNINDQFIEMRCGMSTGIRFGAQKYTTNPEEVTCQRCRNRIENPLMALRKYGQVRVFSEFALSMNYNAWYPIDLVMYSTSKNTYAIASTIKNKQGHLEFIDASNMDDAINKLLTYYETELIPISK